MRFKTCKKLGFDCALNKLYFHVMFKFILLFLIISSSSHRHLSIFQEKPASVGDQLRTQFMVKPTSQPRNDRAAMMLNPSKRKITLRSCFPGELSSCGRISRKVM